MKANRFLFYIILILIVTNIATLLIFSNKDVSEVIEGDNHDVEVNFTDESVAKIGQEEISYEDWMESLRQNYGERHLKEMIDRKIIHQLAKEKNIQVSEKLIEREVSHIATLQGLMSKAEFEKEEEKWRENALLRYQLEELLVGDAHISENEISSHYNKYQNQYDFESALQFSHIVVNSFDQTDKILNELDSGASFHLLAQEYSIDEETKDIGGYLGYYTRTSQFISSKYFEVAEEMEEFSYSEPFQTDKGVVIIYLHRKLPAVTFTYEEIKNHIKNELALKQLGIPLTTEPLWNMLEIEWAYE